MSTSSNEKLVSVIVPIYNAEEYLQECIFSLMNQKYKNIELLLIDDGSTDSSSKICKELSRKDSRITYVYKKNTGVSNTRNIGVEKAKGEFIVFVDSDDIVHSNYIDILVKNFEIDLLPICKYKSFKNNLLPNEDTINNYSYNILNEDDFVELYNYGLLNTPCCKLFRKDIIDKFGIRFEEDISLGEDLLFNLSYLKCIKKIKIIDKVLYYYRFHGNNTLTTSYNKDAKKIQLLLLDKITIFFDKTNNYNTLNNLRMERIITIVENEYKNVHVSLIKRYLGVRKMLNDKEIKKRINNYKRGYNKIKFFLLKNNLFITYKIYNKIFC